MIKPKYLKTGDIVGVVAPSDAVEKKDVKAGAAILESWGLKVKIGKHVYAKVGDFSAGTAEERSEDLLTMINDPEIRVIWAAGGGYAATEILPVFNREIIDKLKIDLKWFIGYSDVCLILNALTSFRMISIMGPNLAGLSQWDKKSQTALKQILFGEKSEGLSVTCRWKAGVNGEATGKLVASNLEALILSFGTRFDPLLYGAGDIILAMEELDIDKSTLQRQIDTVLNHKRAKRIKGVIIGRLTNVQEFSYPEWGKKVTAEGLVTSRVKKMGIPLAFCQDFGHPEWIYGGLSELKYFFANRRFVPLVNGIEAKLTVKDKECSLVLTEEAGVVDSDTDVQKVPPSEPVGNPGGDSESGGQTGEESGL